MSRRGPSDVAHRIEVWNAWADQAVASPKFLNRLPEAKERFAVATSYQRTIEDDVHGLASANSTAVSQRTLPVYLGYAKRIDKIRRREGGITLGNTLEVNGIAAGLIAEGFDSELICAISAMQGFVLAACAA